LRRKKNSGNIATLRARSVVGGRRGGPAKHRVRENDRPTQSNSEGLTVTNIIIIIFSANFRNLAKKKGCFWEKWAEVATLRGKKKLRSPNNRRGLFNFVT
jgi:hypothetical protein